VSGKNAMSLGLAHLGAIENDEKIIKKQKPTNELRIMNEC
jgi:hypothetical protein